MYKKIPINSAMQFPILGRTALIIEIVEVFEWEGRKMANKVNELFVRICIYSIIALNSFK